MVESSAARRRDPSLVLAIRSGQGWAHGPIGGHAQAHLQCGAMATTEDRGAAESLDAWRANVYDRAPERTDELFSTISGIENVVFAAARPGALWRM